MLLRQLELALDNGTMVIVPLSPQPGEETRWKCILTQKSMLDFIVAGGTWRVSYLITSYSFRDKM